MEGNNIQLSFGSEIEDDTLMDHYGTLFSKCLTELKEIDVIKSSEMGSVCLDLIDDVVMRKINKDYRNIDKPTDVISLSYRNGMQFPGKDNLLGEIFISLDTAKKQAEESGIVLEKELDFLFVHGVLHVFGFDHQTEEERRKMFELQDTILKAV